MRAKIQAGLPQPEERRLADAPYISLHNQHQSLPDGGLIREAIRQRQIIQIAYEDSEGTMTDRRVRPLVIWTLTDGWMFSGWCELREDFRTFRSDRIEKVAMTGDRFEEDERTGLRALMQLERQ